jgi:hypothetical protein
MNMSLSRRSFLGGLVAAPAIVRAESLISTSVLGQPIEADFFNYAFSEKPSCCWVVTAIGEWGVPASNYQSYEKLLIRQETIFQALPSSVTIKLI